MKEKLSKEELEAIDHGEDTDWLETLSGIAFNHDTSVNYILRKLSNNETPLDNVQSRRILEKRIKKFGGDSAWKLMHGNVK